MGAVVPRPVIRQGQHAGGPPVPPRPSRHSGSRLCQWRGCIRGGGIPTTSKASGEGRGFPRQGDKGRCKEKNNGKEKNKSGRNLKKGKKENQKKKKKKKKKS